MYASPRWSLEAIKWWGGWAKGESVGQIYKYLLEEYSRIEYDYSDMLSPFRQDRNIAPIDESIGDTPLTRHQFESTIGGLQEQLESIQDTLAAFQTVSLLLFATLQWTLELIGLLRRLLW